MTKLPDNCKKVKNATGTDYSKNVKIVLFWVLLLQLKKFAIFRPFGLL